MHASVSTSTSRRVAVIGQGVIGLTTAARLHDAGFRVTVFSRDELRDTTSFAAGAYWWPHKIQPQNRVADWARRTYQEYQQLCSNPRCGVHFEQHFRFCINPDDSSYVLDLVEEWERIDGADYGVTCPEAFLLTVPVIDVPVFLPWLQAALYGRGIRFRIRELTSPTELFPEFDLVINCTGVYATQFAGDPDVFPIRGQTVRLSLPEGLRHSARLYDNANDLTLVLPRRSDVILGGTNEAGNWSRDPNPDESASMLQRCTQLVPQIRAAETLGVAVGLRPGRHEVRLELDVSNPKAPVIHNYGHGGGGYTVGWGCADEVTELAVEYFSSHPPSA